MSTPSPRVAVRFVVLLALSLAFAISVGRADAVPGFAPLSDMGASTYLGFGGGLYENGTNSAPADHASAGMAHAAAIQPRDASGSPNASGKVVLLSIGMSNTTQEWSALMSQAAASSSVNHTTLVIVDGAAGGQTASTWDASADANYDRVRDQRLTPAGLSESQVQAVWLKVADAGPIVSLPSAASDAYALETFMGNIVRALKTRYPHLQLVFVSSRIYAGYASTTLNPEPYAYESGFAVKWLIQAQIDQARSGGTVVDARAGNLNLATGTPWLAWGPYLWADGTTPRSDGLTWAAGDFAPDGTHPSTSGRVKVADMLMNFFLSSPFAQCWFAVSCAPAATPTPTATPSPDADADGLSDADEATYGTNPADPDTDSDGCFDGREVSAAPGLGGDRDPLYFWDFFDVNGTKSVGLSDTLLILQHFGHLHIGDALDPLLDRNIPNSLKPWRTAEAIDGIGLVDALVNLRSFGHSCA